MACHLCYILNAMEEVLSHFLGAVILLCVHRFIHGSTLLMEKFNT
jgi:hypothetical protein